ncbi:uncharacterized protein PGTG_22603 [Puccinia graminis f. sp. tritici CRL 75-36-700-3]|uniref:Uncharacterized protein n=1 Tax=Puccinia graminis f. sp. tritici (strain CRL 75-36-700-3 / race SCCL) TaxID=418459 RepID=H6QV15_PUCGT|nr:uncharacterized protein PGTG_22603 [Puccinia graminis f. sp. tritici CRL 75-36-700-3]EHS62628.1 hypothetical protein PGTG_22603 [Puccinia graminis f. sp. tritici CRL 75-36-700-3]
MVNLALKRSMTLERAEKYRHHTLEYLQSCLLLFPEVTLAPNHHMSIHLADCLEKIGPSRAWWSFLMERLMGTIVRPLITTVLALLSTPEAFPEQLRPFLPQLQAFQDPIPAKVETLRKYCQASLDSTTLKALIKRLNELFPCPTGALWIPSDEWEKKRKAESTKFLAVNPCVEKLSSCLINKVRFSTFRENPNNSVIALQAGCAPQYGIIEDIISHWRTLGNGTSKTNTWLVIQPLVPCNFSSPFAGITKQFDLQVELRMPHTETLYINHTEEVLAHCAWIKYKAGEILPSIKKECIALVSLDC